MYRGLGDVYKRQVYDSPQWNYKWQFMCLKYSEADGGYKKNGKLY